MLLVSVLGVWAVVTVGFIAVMIWKSFVGYGEEDVLILTAGESRQAVEQQEVIAKVKPLAYWAKVLGFGSLGLLLVAGGIWAYGAFMTFNNPQLP